jgi:SPX domain protein involved in polyphosphate accumulation
MKFGKQFEFHKIPEWYTDYFDYQKFKKLISAFKKKLQGNFKDFHDLLLANEVSKLRGLYYLTSQSSVNQLNIKMG